MAELKFDYTKYEKEWIDPKIVDDLIKIVIESGTGWINTIIAGVKLIIIGAFIWIKWAAFQKELTIAKQKQEVKQTNDLKDQINKDSLD